jgi:hypothetical protein
VIALLAALVAFACAAASAWRMWLASHATGWHPADVLAAMGRAPDRAAVDRLRDAAARDPRADWERELFEALGATDPRVRVARVNEQLTELDYRIHRWGTVPRICARIATSSAFLLAALVLRNALAETTDFSEAAMRGLLSDGLTVVFMGFAGTGFCLAASRHARGVARERLEGADALVETLESLVPAEDREA